MTEKEYLTCPKCGDEIEDADAMELHEEVCIGEETSQKTLIELSKEIMEYVKANGFGEWLTWERFPKACTYLHSEVSEAFEAWRDNNQILVGEELADLAIRLFHTASVLGYDLTLEIQNKMKKNWKRKFQHGRKI